MARFTDRLTFRLHGAKDILRIMAQGGFAGWRHDRTDAAKVPRRHRAGLRGLPQGKVALTWVGHATFVLQCGDRSVLFDPVFTPRIRGVVRRITDPGVPLSGLPQIHAVCLSHNHFDHTDLWSLRRIRRDQRRRFGSSPQLFVPLGLGRFAAKKTGLVATELDWWEGAELDGFRFTFVPAHHWSRRTPFDANRSLWGGWWVEVGGKAVYHAGDTGYGDAFKQIRRRLGTPDVAMLPIGAYAPRWFMGPIHMDPEEAVRATMDLGGPILATMHWGTYVLTREPILEPLERVRRAWRDTPGLPALWDMALGERRTLPA